MGKTYGAVLNEWFAVTRLAGTRAYRTRGGAGTQTFVFLQTDRYRLQIVSAVVAEPENLSLRQSQVVAVLDSIDIQP
jgi:hypothetical protein